MICLRLGSLTFPMCEKSEEAILQQVRCSAVPGGEQEDQIDNQFMDAERSPCSSSAIRLVSISSSGTALRSSMSF